MKRSIIFFIVVAVTALLSANCRRDDAIGSDGEKGVKTVPMTFSSFTDCGTKVVIDSLFLKWSADDSIMVFDALTSHTFHLESGAGTTSARFSGEAAEMGPYWALSPFAPGAVKSGDIISGITIPDTQIVSRVQNTDSKSMLMLAVTNDKDTLRFDNMVSYIKVTPMENCDSIILMSNNSEPLVGTGNIDVLQKSFSITSGSSSVKLKGVLTEQLDSGSHYYFAVCPVTLSKGLSITFYKTGTNGEVYRTSERISSVALQAGRVYNGGGGKSLHILWAEGDEYRGKPSESQYWHSSLGTPKYIIVDTCFSGGKSVSAVSLNRSNTLWAEKEADTVFIRTSGSVIEVFNDCYYLFAALRLVDSISDFGAIRFSNANYVNNLFWSDTSLSSVNAARIDVSKATDMSQMFYECSSLTSLDLSSWSTSNATDVNSMFYGCKKLQSLTLSNDFRIESADKSELFSGCGTKATGGCTVYGVTDEDLKTALKTGTGWDDTYMSFAE